MIIKIDKIDPTLPCAHLNGQATASVLCGRPAILGIVISLTGGAWELLPLCSEHTPGARATHGRSSEVRDVARQPLLAK